MRHTEEDYEDGEVYSNNFIFLNIPASSSDEETSKPVIKQEKEEK